MDDQSAIRTLIHDRTTAMRTGDAETICSTYAPDAVVFSLAPPLVQPVDGTRDIGKLQAWFAEKGGSAWSEVHDLQVTVDGDLALCTSLNRMALPRIRRTRSPCGTGPPSGCGGPTTSGGSSTNTPLPRSTWTARCAPPPTCNPDRGQVPRAPFCGF